MIPNHHAGMQNRSVANRDVIAKRDMRPNRAIRADPRVFADHGGRVNAYRRMKFFLEQRQDSGKGKIGVGDFEQIQPFRLNIRRDNDGGRFR